MQFIDKSCREFTEELASKAPVPGGGGASALIGALGTALGNMVGQLTVGKEKYADVEEDILDLMERAKKVQDDLLALVEKDAYAFEPLANAYKLPVDTEEKRLHKERVIAVSLKVAASVPLEIMKKCCEAIDIQAEFASKGSQLAVSDAGCGVILCKSALQAAGLNVFINTKAMKDKITAEEMNAEADEMLFEYTVKADEVYASVFSHMRD